MVRRRRRMERSDAARLTSFVESDWPGGCVRERLLAWQLAGQEAYLSDRSVNAVEVIRAWVKARRAIHAHAKCDYCADFSARRVEAAEVLKRRYPRTAEKARRIRS